ncbi:MAG: Ni/Fe hydrogenase subunit alpha [Thermoproteota archaeon]|jgi:coenzyme F420-reducing hydrogenase alpha subunit
MNNKREISLRYISRVEGQGSVLINVRDNTVESVLLNIFEPPRFFERFLIGRKFDEVHYITSRICGICPIAHVVTALRAVENAVGIEVDEQTKTLRKLLAMSGIIQSHVLHVFFLAAPDYLGYPDAIAMANDYPEVVKKAFKLKKLANEISATIGGRAVHPVSASVGGFLSFPSEEKLMKLKNELIEAKKDAEETVKLVARFSFPELIRKQEFVALSKSNEYAIYDGNLVSSEGLKVQEKDYRQYIEEHYFSHSNAKFSNLKHRGSFVVGPLARVNLNYNLLNDEAKRVAEEVGFRVPENNVFKATLARAIEVVHFIEESIKIIGETKIKEVRPTYSWKPGFGTALTEAPRGLLYHSYKIGKSGLVEEADIVTPTAHNAYNIENDIKTIVPKTLNLKSEEEVKKVCEMLVRAYDPCISCSVHFLNLNVER